MNHIFRALGTLLLFVPLAFSCSGEEENDEPKPEPEPKRILIFSKTEGFRHACIDPGKVELIEAASQEGWKADTTEDAAYFNSDSLKKYGVVVFFNTSGDVLNSAQEAAFEAYIRSGGGYVGIHAASDTEYGWAWYGRLVGAYFDSHPAVQQATVLVEDTMQPSTQHLSPTWMRNDEWYNFQQKPSPDSVQLLALVDESSYQGGKHPQSHPICWYHEFDGGRSWYTAMGHTTASYTEADFVKHIMGGIRYAGDWK